MKFTIFAASTMAALASAKPSFTNSNFDVQEGEPFELTFDGCDSGCTILLENGSSTNLQEVSTLTSDASGGSFTVTLKDLPSDTYAFKIVDNSDDTFNYSKQFEYEGTASATTSASTMATTGASSTMASSTMTTSESTMTSDSSSMSTGSMTSMTTMTTGTATTSDSASSTTDAPASSTTVPGAAGRVSSPMALVAGAVAAMVAFN